MTQITFTASRTVTPRQTDVMRDVCLEIGNTFRWDDKKFISGAALGGDTFLALTCLFLYPNDKHLIAIPDYAHNHIMVAALREWAHPNLEIVNTGLTPVKRNDFMLDLGDLLYAFPQSNKEQARGSGTWAAIRHARKLNMPILVHPLSGSAPWKENV